MFLHQWEWHGSSSLERIPIPAVKWENANNLVGVSALHLSHLSPMIWWSRRVKAWTSCSYERFLHLILTSEEKILDNVQGRTQTQRLVVYGSETALHGKPHCCNKNAAFPIRFQRDPLGFSYDSCWCTQRRLSPLQTRSWSWARLNFSGNIALRLPITCPGDLTPAQHSEWHDSTSHGGVLLCQLRETSLLLHNRRTSLPPVSTVSDMVWMQPRSWPSWNPGLTYRSDYIRRCCLVPPSCVPLALSW